MTNQRLFSESQPTSGDLLKVVIRDKESQLGNRLREVIGEESVASFSRRCSLGDSTLRKYLDGAVPSAINLVAIADAANVNIEWLAAGRGTKVRGESIPIDHAVLQVSANTSFDDYERLVLAISTVEAALAASNKVLPPDKRAQVIAISYRILADRDQRDNVVEFIKMAA